MLFVWLWHFSHFTAHRFMHISFLAALSNYACCVFGSLGRIGMPVMPVSCHSNKHQYWRQGWVCALLRWRHNQHCHALHVSGCTLGGAHWDCCIAVGQRLVLWPQGKA